MVQAPVALTTALAVTTRRWPRSIVTSRQLSPLSARVQSKEAPALQPGQIAVDQPWRGRGGAGAEIALLQQDHAQTASGGVARDADAIQPAADDRKIVIRHAKGLSRFRSA